jgi:hypothetical protein
MEIFMLTKCWKALSVVLIGPALLLALPLLSIAADQNDSLEKQLRNTYGMTEFEPDVKDPTIPEISPAEALRQRVCLAKAENLRAITSGSEYPWTQCS